MKSIIAIALLTLSLSGCFFSNQPSDSDIQAMSKNEFNQEFYGLFLAQQVVKHNGFNQNETRYVAEVSVMGEAQTTLEKYSRSVLNDSALSAMEKLKHTMGIGVLSMTLPEFAQGDVIEFERYYLFIKTDKGWRLEKSLSKEERSEFVL